MSDFTWIHWPTRNTLAQKEKTWKRHHITAKSWAEGCAEKKQSLFFNVLTNKESLCVFFPVLKQFNLFCAEWWEEIRVPCLVSCHDRSEKWACRDNITNTCVLLSPSSTFSRMFTLQWIGWIRRNINTYHKVQDTFYDLVKTSIIKPWSNIRTSLNSLREGSQKKKLRNLRHMPNLWTPTYLVPWYGRKKFGHIFYTLTYLPIQKVWTNLEESLYFNYGL